MENKIQIDNLSLNYEVTGPENGKPIVLMHGWGCEHSTVSSIASILNSDHRVYNIDLPGHGKSDEPTGVWGIEDFTRLIEKFIIALNIKTPSLIGHSFGGRISILYGSRNKTDKIVLVDSAGVKPKRSLKYYWKVYSFKTLKKIIKLLYGKKK